MKIVFCLFPVLGFFQTRGKIAAGQFIDLIQFLTLFFPKYILSAPVRFRNGNIRPIGQRLDCFGKRAIVNFFYKTEYISAGMAPVAVKKLPFFIH